MTTWINAIYPHYGSAVRKQLFMAWPEERWTACGYSCPSLGQVTSIYPRLEEGIQNKLFFAGEYASLLFTGYMEGALHSGAVLAGRIAKRLNLA
jgi:monoamine oxidase